MKFNDLGKQWQEIKDLALPKLINTLEKGDYILGNSVTLFENAFADYVGAKYSVGVANGTDALKLAVASLNLKGSSIFYIPANTYIATLFGVLASNTSSMTYELIDCDNYHQISIKALEDRMDKTASFYDNNIIMPVHLYGHSCNMMEIEALKNKYNSIILEDCAQAHGTITEYGTHVGNSSKVAAYSLYPGKNLGAAGDAGIITTSCPEIYDRLLYLRNIGATQKYHHDNFGWNSRLDTLQAIILEEKLKKLETWITKKNYIATVYLENIKEYEHFSIAKKAFYCERHSYHLFVVRSAFRDFLFKELNSNKIPCLMHYPITLENSKALRGTQFNCINANNLSNNIISLPMHPYLTDNELDYIINTINTINKNI